MNKRPPTNRTLRDLSVLPHTFALFLFLCATLTCRAPQEPSTVGQSSESQPQNTPSPRLVAGESGYPLVSHTAACGVYIAFTHLVGNTNQPAVHLAQAWLVGNALTILDRHGERALGTVLLDDQGRGAANPWDLAFTADGKTLVVAHAGTHEVSIIDVPALVQAVLKLPAPVPPGDHRGNQAMSQQDLALSAYTPFFPSRRHRLRLPEGDLGPREVAIVGDTAYVTNYFSETISVIDLRNLDTPIRSIPKHGAKEPLPRTNREVLERMSLVRRGEFYFHDATICFQEWQSCSSCHPDGRADGLNWDLLNDGVRNPKNTKSLLLAHQTPPAMSLGVRETAEMAVRAGLRHILFTNAPEEIALAIDEYLKSLRPKPSPFLVNGRLTKAAEHGKAVFAKAGCSNCHSPPLFTDLHSYDVGTRGPTDKPTDTFDTPTLIEVWRTPPYLHDGSASTIRDVITRRNLHDLHGSLSGLSAGEIDDLCEYVLSL